MRHISPKPVYHLPRLRPYNVYWYNKRKPVDMFTYLGSSVSSTNNDINSRLAKSWTVTDWLSVIWKSDLTDKIKCSFFQVAVASVLLYGCTTCTVTKCKKKKIDGYYTRMLRAILNKFRGQQPTKQQLYPWKVFLQFCWDCWIHRLVPPPASLLDMYLNHLMAWFQSRNLGEHEVPLHYL